MNKAVRVLVANRPRLMRELITTTISDHADIEVVGEVQNESEILELIDLTHPDFLILASEESGQPSSLCASILQTHPEIKIIAITPNMNGGTVFWASLSIHTNEIEASEEGVLRTLRGRSQAGARVQ